MTEGLTGNEEVCSVTGRPANARFDQGIGRAWYGSRHDLTCFVDLSGRFDGPLCDEEIDKALAAGEIVATGNSMDGQASASDIPVEAAVALFLAGMQRQIELLSLDEAPQGAAVRRIGGISAVLQNPDVPEPAWLARIRPVASGTGGDFWKLGAAYALATLASGGIVEHDAAEAAARECHAFEVAMEREERDMRFSLDEMFADLSADHPAP